MRALFALLLLAACSSEPAKTDNGLNQTMSDSQRPPFTAPAKPNVAAGSSTTVPVSLQGRWTGAADDCFDEGAGLGLQVTPDALIFHESVGTVKTVETDATGRVTIKADFTGEGQSWTRQLLLRPSTDGQRLTIANDGLVVTRKRCVDA